MRIGVPKERLALETRAAATPKTVEQLLKLGFSVAVESGAGKLVPVSTTRPSFRLERRSLAVMTSGSPTSF